MPAPSGRPGTDGGRAVDAAAIRVRDVRSSRGPAWLAGGWRLFRDNVLWDEEGEGGVIDFYFACDDALLYDLAITVNDWCTDSFATLDPDRADALLQGYDAHRPLTDLERELWPVMLRRAALRTWLGRLEYNHFPKASEMTIPKDHAFYRRLLEHHIVHARALEAAGD